MSLQKLFRQAIILTTVCFLCGPAAIRGDEGPRGFSETPVYSYRIVKSYPHDPSAFTQGLFFHKGFLYESTGLYGSSSLRKVELLTGKVKKIRRFSKKTFGEGITLWGNKIVMITWQSGEGYLFNVNDFRLTGQFRYGTEGWGITSDGVHLIMSDGSSTLQFMDPETFRVVKKIIVSDMGREVDLLNELEYIKGEIFANIFGSGYIVRISPETGRVTGWIDLSRLAGELGQGTHADVLNGIAYDREKDRIFVTGKLWPKLFEIRMVANPKR